MRRFCKKCGEETDRYKNGQCKVCHYKYKRSRYYKGVNVKSTTEAQIAFRQLAYEYCVKHGYR